MGVYGRVAQQSDIWVCLEMGWNQMIIVHGYFEVKEG